MPSCTQFDVRFISIPWTGDKCPSVGTYFPLWLLAVFRPLCCLLHLHTRCFVARACCYGTGSLSFWVTCWGWQVFCWLSYMSRSAFCATWTQRVAKLTWVGEPSVSAMKVKESFHGYFPTHFPHDLIYTIYASFSLSYQFAPVQVYYTRHRVWFLSCPPAWSFKHKSECAPVNLGDCAIAFVWWEAAGRL